MELLVVGSVALDTVKSPAGEREEMLGGSAIYFSAAASYFGPVRLVGVVGEDFPWDEVEFLRERGVDLEGLEIAEGKTFRWSGVYPEEGERETLLTRLNVFENFRPKIPAQYRSSEMVFLANIDPVLQLEVLRQVGNARLSACDTMNFWIDSKLERVFEVLSRVQMAFFNDGEARSVVRESNLPLAVEKIHAGGPAIAVVKKGENGALMSYKGSMFAVPAFPLKDVQDPTGAGDSFAGGMMGYLLSKGSLERRTFREAVIYGTVMASFAVEGFGVERLKVLREEDIEQRAAKLVGMISLSPRNSVAGTS
ncbi:MAG: sugar kinase [Candidatus Eisenbacteria sp.]|nr:sugar kinase [Candidatus Eisenbacteria bacterium]